MSIDTRLLRPPALESRSSSPYWYEMNQPKDSSEEGVFLLNIAVSDDMTVVHTGSEPTFKSGSSNMLGQSLSVGIGQ